MDQQIARPRHYDGGLVVHTGLSEAGTYACTLKLCWTLCSKFRSLLHPRWCWCCVCADHLTVATESDNSTPMADLCCCSPGAGVGGSGAPAAAASPAVPLIAAGQPPAHPAGAGHRTAGNQAGDAGDTFASSIHAAKCIR